MNGIGISKGLKVLEIPYMGRQIHPTLIWDDEIVVLVDAGFPGQLHELRKAMDEAGIPLSKLSKVFITHQDVDHIGGLQEILKVSDHKIEVIAHKQERPFIEGEKPLIKMTPERLAGMFGALPAEKRKETEARFLESLKSKVDKTVNDGEVLPYCGGITVIFTPGHTPGHICLYLSQYKTLITGDALNVINGQLVGPNVEYTPDMDMARKSLEKLTQYDIETVICYHGGVYQENVKMRLLELAKG
ncbi:MAG: MBL fold metallo-hydrolase [Ignavibacteriaceae bacterium]|nr:MBL fold metallo-hydrolase [Ignavibacteriaceae bacterium]